MKPSRAGLGVALTAFLACPSWAAGQSVTAVALAYMTERSFFRSDVRVAFEHGVKDVGLRVGCGFDFQQRKAMKKTTAVVLTAILVLHSSHAVWGQVQRSRTGQTSTLAGEFVSRLPVGTNIRLKLDDGAKMTGTLMAVEDDSIIVKRRARTPEPLIKLTLNRIVDADVQRGSGLGRGMAIGAAVGVAATFGVLLFLAAMLGD